MRARKAQVKREGPIGTDELYKIKRRQQARQESKGKKICLAPNIKSNLKPL